MLRLFYAIIAMAALAVVLVLFYASSIISTTIEKVGSEAVGAPVKVGSMDIGFLSGEGHIKNLTVGNPEGFIEEHAFELGEVYLKLDPVSLFGSKIHIEEVRVKEPMVFFEGTLNGSNFQAIQRNVQDFANRGGQPEAVEPKNENAAIDAEIAKERSHSEGKKLQLDLFVMEQAQVDVSMNVAGKLHNAKVALPKLEIKDIGKEGEGASAADVVNKIIQPVAGVVLKTSSQTVVDLKGQVNKVKGDLTNRLKKEGEGLVNKLFGR